MFETWNRGGEILGNGENNIMRNITTSRQILLNDEVKEYEMGRACSTHGVLVVKPGGKH